MTDTAMANPCETATPNRLGPPRVRLPKLVQGVVFAFFRRRAMRNWIKRHGHIFEINVPFFGRSVVVSDPALVRSVCTASAEQLSNVQPNLGNLFGPGSVFGLDGSRHRDRRRLLAPAFHGQCLKNYEKVIEDETLRESANWPEGKEFRILEPMNRITLNVILRTILGADGAELEELREIVPAMDDAGIGHGICAEAAIPHRAPQPVGQAGRVPQGIRPDRIDADRQGRGRSESRRAGGHPGVVAAQRSRRRNRDAAARHMRRTVGPHRCGPRKHGVSAGLGL